MATEKQIRFMKKLADERLATNKAGEVDPEGRTVADLLKVAFSESKGGVEGYWTHMATLATSDISEKIDRLMAAPKAPKPVADTGYASEAKKGDVHVLDGDYYRIHVGQKSGHPYAVKATIVSEAVWVDGKVEVPGVIEWEHAPSVLRKLSTETLTTPEQAAAFGHLVGRCCFCSHVIDTLESTTVGYGPVCAEKYGLPWGDTKQVVA